MRDDVGDDIAARRARAMPCLCDRHESEACTLVHRAVRGRDSVEHLLCRCGVTFRRVWIGDR